MFNADAHYKLLFSHPELVHDLLKFTRVVRPDSLDFDSLTPAKGSYVSDRGKKRRNDLVWKLRFKDDRWIHCYLLLEFQARSDHWMSVRMLSYVGLLYQDLIRRNEFLSKDKLPPVLPLVLYHGKTSWRAATDLSELLLSCMPLQAFQPAQRYWLIDEGDCDTSLFETERNLAAAVFRLRQSAQDQDLQDRVDQLGEWLSKLGNAALRDDFGRFISALLQWKYGDTTIPITADFAELKTVIAEKHRLSWKEQAILEGLVQGEARVLSRQLKRRFGTLPDWVETKLATATETDLLHWSENVVDAKNLGEIFVR